ncbi:MAG: histidinol dehydrogenase [bacterium]|nr:histidinol dehydrogenase [bacterium]
MVAKVLLRLLSSVDADFDSEFATLIERRTIDENRIQDAVAKIIADVRQRGDDAVLDAIERFDGYRLRADQLELGREEIDAGAAQLPDPERQALADAAARVERFHREQAPRSWTRKDAGETLGQLIRPVDSAAIYIPGGTAPLASSVLMVGIPARVAGVEERVMTSPGQTLPPAVLEAARLAAVTRLFRMGGVQAVAALAYGTQSVPRVDKIVGPGNAYVQEAKRQVFGQVGIDAEAGPSEVFVVAESGADANLLAADLLAQAEHDPMSSVVLATPDSDLAREVVAAVGRQIGSLARAEIARTSLTDRGAVIVCRDLEEAVDLANRYAAEHLQLFVSDGNRWLPRVRNAGAVFVGPYSPVPLGDYIAGPSHTLPTGGTARFFSVLGVDDFIKRMSLIEFDAAALARVAPAAALLADLEGLDAHARALRARAEPGGDPESKG